ncbi:hypothetical protein GCM10023201_12410 [Actinomycetospora corticicola]|uniref:Uncharacterized protein YukE n=1 Tax=Actinomycetospora corticicola TaxID=663602 RepID=A0A7Y9J8H6_9PSEU|nr:WXG100 family type VII secretion target [Actinomycetospora corticicola]NYD38439.1 uncharacterized protein YukE [Actinomycetospora corticicola]
MPSVGWDGRDVSGLSHEQIHRWTRDGASPEALAAARDRHLARADELRGAADRLQAAQRGVGETWAGRDADAAGNRTRILAQRMEQLAETVGGQARGLDGMRTALVRVQAAVGPPRPSALPALGVTPVLDELRALVTGRPADSYGAFRTAAADQAAAREAYRAYLGETASAARAVGPAGAGPTPAAGDASVAPGRAPLPVGARGAASGVLQRAAGPVPTAGAGAPAPPAAGLRPPVPATGAPVPVRASGPVSATTPVGGPGTGGARAIGGGPGAGGGPGVGSVGGAPGSGAPGSGGGEAGGTGARPAGAGPGGAVAGSPTAPGGGAGGPVGAGNGAGTAIVGPSRGVVGPRGAAAGLPPGRTGAAPPRGPDGRERAPSAVGGPSGPPGMLDDQRPGDFGPDATSPGADEPAAADPEQPVVPVRHVTWLVDPDPAGWGAPGRRVAPPVLGEGP